MEDALYGSRAMRALVGIVLGTEPAHDETTVCRFRHLLEAHQLGSVIFEPRFWIGCDYCAVLN
ncbi:MAG: transposase [Nitrospira sp.]|nr:transposase [Nitrospira sp.]